MSIISEKKECSIKEISYPCLMRSGSKIVLMTKPKEGTVVYIEEGDSSFKIGEYCTFWDMNCFKHYYGTITLENKK